MQRAQLGRRERAVDGRLDVAERRAERDRQHRQAGIAQGFRDYGTDAGIDQDFTEYATGTGKGILMPTMPTWIWSLK